MIQAPNNLLGRLLVTDRAWYSSEEEYLKWKETHDNLKIDAAQVWYATQRILEAQYLDFRACGLDDVETKELLIDIIKTVGKEDA